MFPLKYSRVFERLDKVRGNSTKGMCRCPAHDDRTPSLSWRISSSGKLLLSCMAGCTPQAILQAIGLNFRDLFPDGDNMSGQTIGKVIKTYEYRDEGNQLLYQVVRREPKDFGQRRPNPLFDATLEPGENNRPWIYSLDGVRRVPYRLPDLLRLLQRWPKHPVFIAEGEKDVDRLIGLNLIATTNPGGAGCFDKIAEQVAELVRGRNVCILEDADAPGQKRSMTVANALRGVASRVKVLRFFDDQSGRDVSDWLDAQPLDWTPRQCQQALLDYLVQNGVEVKPAVANTQAATAPETAAPADFDSLVAEARECILAKLKTPLGNDIFRAMGAITLHYDRLRESCNRRQDLLLALARLTAVCQLAGAGLLDKGE